MTDEYPSIDRSRLSIRKSRHVEGVRNLNENEKAPGKSLAERIEDLEQHDLLRFRNLTARQYLNRIAADISLNSLYTVHSASNFSQFDKYMAVQLKLGHQMRQQKIPETPVSDDDPLKCIEPVKMSPQAVLAGLTVSLSFCMVKIERSLNEAGGIGGAPVAGGAAMADQNIAGGELNQPLITGQQPKPNPAGGETQQLILNIISNPGCEKVVKKCFSVLFFLLEGYMPRWATVQQYLLNYPAFVNKFKALPMDGYTNIQQQWLFDFANDPECSASLIRDQKPIIKNFVNWIHCVAKFNLEKQAAQKMLLSGGQDQGLNQPYLLQVWNLEGAIVYERELQKPLMKWNLFDDNFIFQEKPDEVIILKLPGENRDQIDCKLIQLEDQHQPVPLQNIADPSKASGGYTAEGHAKPKKTSSSNIFSGSSKVSGDNFFNGLDDQDPSAAQSDLVKMKKAFAGQKRPLREIQHFAKPSHEAPDRTIGIHQGILVVIENSHFGKDTVLVYYHLDLDCEDQVVLMPRSEAYMLNYKQDSFKWKMMVDAGNGDAVIIAEDQKHAFNRLEFFRLNVQEPQFNASLNARGINGPKSKLQLIRQGLKDPLDVDDDEEVGQSYSYSTASVKDMICVFYNCLRNTDKVDNGTSVMVCIALHEDHTVSTYADCSLIEHWQMQPPKCEKGKEEDIKCVDIEYDGNFFLIKTTTILSAQAALDQSDTAFTAMKYQLYKCEITWRSQIDQSQFRVCKNLNKYNLAIHQRMSPFFRLYVGLCNVGTYLLAAHRKCVTLFDISQSSGPKQFIQTVSFESDVINICTLDEEANPYTEIMGNDSMTFFSSLFVVTADNCFWFLQPTPNALQVSSEGIHMQGELVSCIDDQQCEQAIFFINDLDELWCYAGGCDPQKIEIPSEIHTIDHNVTQASYYPYFVDPDEYDDGQMKAFEEKGLCEGNSDGLTSRLLIETGDLCSLFAVKRYQTAEEKEQYKGFRVELDLVKTINKGQHEVDNDNLVAAISISGDTFPDQKGWMIRCCERSIAVYNADGALEVIFQNIYIKDVKWISNNQFTILVNPNGNENVVIYTLEHTEIPTIKPNYEETFTSLRFSQAGFYMIDTGTIANQRKLMSFKLSNGIVGTNDASEYCLETQRLTFLTDNNSIHLINFPHLNTISFLGMYPKNEYLIWRQKNGFFCALHKDGHLQTWSMLTGNLLYTRQLNLEVGFEPYMASDEDTGYKADHYELRDRTIQLLWNKDGVKLNETGGDKQITDQYSNTRYKFKVIQMQIHQDRDEYFNLIGEEKITQLFNFELNLQTRDFDLEKEDENNEPQNRIFLSQDTKMIMVVQQGTQAELYVRSEPNVHTQQVELTLVQRIQQYPKLLQQNYPFNFAFSPNFQYRLGISFKEKKFYIESTALCKGKYIKIDVPSDLLYSVDEANTVMNQEKVREFVQRFSFITDDMFRMINKEGIDCIWSFRDGKTVQIEDYCKWLNWKEDHFSEDHHLFLGNVNSESDGGLLNDIRTKRDRVMSKQAAQQFWENQRKRNQSLVNSSVPPMPRDPDEIQSSEDIFKRYFHCRKLLSNYFTVDYYAGGNNPEGVLQSTQSFVVADWILMDQLCKADKNKVEQILSNLPSDIFIRLFFNVLPSGDTFLHRLMTRADSTVFVILAKGFEVAQELGVEIPIMLNSKGQTPIDYVLELEAEDYKIYKQPDIVEIKSSIFDVLFAKAKPRTQNLLAAQKMLEGIQNYGFMHSGYLLTRAIVEATMQNIPNVGEFLSQRCVMSAHQPSGMCHNLDTRPSFFNFIEAANVRNDEGDIEFIDYKVCELQTWDRLSVGYSRMFKKDGIKRKMRTFYLDIPDLHKNSKNAYLFVEALRDIQDVGIFGYFPIQALINYHWAKSRVSLMSATFLPYLILLVFYTIWVFVELQSDEFILEMPMRGSIICLATYFIMVETKQMKNLGLVYFTDVQNFIELIPLALVLYSAFVASLDGFEISYTFYVIQACVIFLFWLKILFFMRLFRTTGYLVYSIQTVISEMASFLLILSIVIIAFAYSFLSLNYACNEHDSLCEPDIEGDGHWVKQISAVYFSFLMVMGDYSTEGFDIVATMFFIFASILEIIILLNVLIAIVSNSYQKIQDDEVLYTFLTRSAMIKEWQYFLGRLYFKVGERSNRADLLFFAAEEEDIKCNSWLSPSTIPPDKVEEEDVAAEVTQGKIEILEKKMEYEMGKIQDKFSQVLDAIATKQ